MSTFKHDCRPPPKLPGIDKMQWRCPLCGLIWRWGMETA